MTFEGHQFLFLLGKHQDFLASALLTLWTELLFAVEDCLVHRRTLSSVLGLCRFGEPQQLCPHVTGTEVSVPDIPKGTDLAYV